MLAFLLGLLIGIGVFVRKQYQTDRQLTEMLQILSQFDKFDIVNSLPKIAQVRRNINLLNQKLQDTQLELDLYRCLLEQAPVGYLRIDKENHLIECNQEAKKLLCIQRWQSGQFRFLLELVRSYELDQLIQQTRKTKQHLIIEWQFFPSNDYALDSDKSKEEEDFQPIFLKAYSITLPEVQVGIFLLNMQLLHDLTSRRDQAYSDLSHELRTPLTSISLLAETLTQQTKGQAQVWVKQIYQQTNRLTQLVENWLKIAQLEKNPYENIKLQRLDLKPLIISAWNTVSMLAAQENISFEYQGLETTMVEADINYLTQVFINLFDNSIKHCSAKESILVEVKYQASQKPNFIQIDLIDSGTGFHADDLPHIFERLYRGDKSRARTSREGSGLGLSIVKKIVEAHKGTITAQNHPLTGGAWFSIILPSISAM